MGVPGVGEHECVMIENQRWSIRHREYRNDALMVKVRQPSPPYVGGPHAMTHCVDPIRVVTI